jgi:predicted  nucleic acid-binding Zn ribbon protein
LVLLSEPEFSSAVQLVLKHFTQAHLLQHNPLVHSRLLAAYPLPERVAALQQLIYSSAESLQASPKEAKGYRALYHTYLQPLGSQEQVADHLDIPFSSYRRHLKQGIEQLTQILWQQEIN